MGQIESKIFEEAPPWDMDTLLSNTDLDKTAINLCWRNWSVYSNIDAQIAFLAYSVLELSILYFTN